MVPKDNNKLFPQNYRPVNLLSAMSKVAERIIHRRIKEYIEELKRYPSGIILIQEKTLNRRPNTETRRVSVFDL